MDGGEDGGNEKSLADRLHSLRGLCDILDGRVF
jgi:hypothetical protein